ncbi:bifunctional 3-oxoadipate enol-lactonase/4-carboxymuconolactone decarboxylase PcaDC [Actinacidiphila guanduensis]|uniref:4-carboxymuconolactone decarboxylase /3-oxoadipate enol-lactonase n=1 Tax=Actinacidiphila guanduensis TaxID=310781 RepID=A0A1H0K2B1_9ACTN|nr:alpha/beta fold hydrolase [Actinacidiphila guanduensis]SDO50168.1 4-carboxymuconolactone decarboxylase /3-oxoadipate enol-lactonase [Actinacidiphila guanduensis]
MTDVTDETADRLGTYPAAATYPSYPGRGTTFGEGRAGAVTAARTEEAEDPDDRDDLQPPLQYRFDGPDGAPVLVLGPALGSTWHMWDRQLPELTGTWRVLRFELPGHGGAPAEPASTVDNLARRLLAVLDDEGVDTFGYAGCELGAAVGARLALLRPDRLAALALVSAAARFGTADTWRQRGVVVRANGLDRTAANTPQRWFTHAFLSTQPAITDWAVQMVRTTDTACYIAACEALAAFDIRDQLSSITVPTLVVAGADDTETPPADARLLVAGIPDARLAVVPGTGHLAPVEEPTAVGTLLAHHFESAWAERTPAATPFPPVPAAVAPRAPAAPAAPDSYAEGMRIRRELVGDAEVESAIARASTFGANFDEFATRWGWGETWTRPGLDRRTRNFVALTALTALGRLADLADHTRAALRGGLTPAEIEETLLHTAVYCGLPAARAAVEAARAVIAEETGTAGG